MGEQENSFECRDLFDYQISTESVYELLFRLIIYDSGYFENKEGLITEHFDSLEEFYLKLFTSHLAKFVEAGESFHLHLYALSALVETKGYYRICRRVITELGTLKDQTIELEDAQGNQV